MIEGERKLATVRRIGNVEPIEGADLIVKATIDGWELVTQKDNFKINDLCLYFEIDSFLPVREEFEFLRKSSFKSTKELGDGFRIKTIKLRGQISQGLALPLKDFFGQSPDGSYYYVSHESGPVYLQEGLDLTEYFGVQKYEKPASGGGFHGGWSKGDFPQFLRKTDQERIQNCFGSVKSWINYAKSEVEEVTNLDLLRDLELLGVGGKYFDCFKSGDQWYHRSMIPNDPLVVEQRNLFEVTLKLDGSSMTVYHNEGSYGVCSRNLDLKRDANGLFWKTAMIGKVPQALVSLGRNIALQGELMGPGVQGNREKLEEHRFFIFDIYDIDLGRYLTSDERCALIEILWFEHGMSIHFAAEVPCIGVIDFSKFETVKDVLDFAERDSLCRDVTAEGIVFKSILENGRTFKAISNKFLLKEKD